MKTSSNKKKANKKREYNPPHFAFVRADWLPRIEAMPLATSPNAWITMGIAFGAN